MDNLAIRVPRGVESTRLPTVLAVDDDRVQRWFVAHVLRRNKLRCVEAETGEQALERVTRNPGGIDAIVLDAMMPGMTGMEVLDRLKRVPETATIPVIMVSASATHTSQIVGGLERGAADYLTKPYSPEVLVAKIRGACGRAQSTRRLSSQLRAAELESMTDAVTGLSNRKQFEERLRAASAMAKRHGKSFSVIMIDLDHFKGVNDTFGHAEGDAVLTHVAAAMRSVLRASDGAFRFGGDEFVLLLLRECDGNEAATIAARLRGALHERPFVFSDGIARPISFSAGVAAARSEEDFTTEGVVARADAALYRAKGRGRDQIEKAEDAVRAVSARSAEPSQSPEPRGPTSEVRCKRPLILYVEDQFITRSIYAAFLRRAGFRVAEVSDGVQAVERAIELVPDLVLMDLGLPVVDGLEATRRIKKNPKTRHIPVVALSASDAPAGGNCLLGCDYFLTKSMSGPEVVRHVIELLVAPRKTAVQS
jgi:diguanylate cyclase (GGDEF)-like protein